MNTGHHLQGGEISDFRVNRHLDKCDSCTTLRCEGGGWGGGEISKSQSGKSEPTNLQR